ncbi:MAG: hypothetical protein NT106_14570 [Candidatus Sumerlaeota bacterium]|nr:hypothetical protein [Candidatus Sumerlaeota bacterium]
MKDPFRLFSNKGNDLRGVANISMCYAHDNDEAFRTQASEMALYKWDPAMKEWLSLKSTRLPEFSKISALINSLAFTCSPSRRL